MKTRSGPLTALVSLSLAFSLTGPPAASANPILEQWKEGLSGALLTAYSGSVVSSHSSLTTLRLCRSGRFRLDRDASWNAGGAAMGASQGLITGTWSVEARGPAIVVTYVTDAGDRGAYPVHLQNDGRVNLGGVSYAAQRGGAGC